MRSVLLVSLFVAGTLLFGQTFVEVPGQLPSLGVHASSVAFADVDNNGTLDVVVTGIHSTNSIAKLYLNDGTGIYTEKMGVPFEGVSYGSVAFADVDQNGTSDLLLTGQPGLGQPIAKLYLNDGTGTFTENQQTPFVGVSGGAVAFADVDSNGTADVIITGKDGTGAPFAKLYLNDGSGTFSQKLNTNFIGLENSALALADVDHDGHLDILVTGKSTGGGLISRLYLNNGSGFFIRQYNTPFVGVEFGSVAFADVDNNGSQDVLISGWDENFVPTSKLYMNDGTGLFTETPNTPFEGVAEGAIAFADIDMNNTQDVLMTGRDGSNTRITKLYLNDGLGTFTEKTNTPFEGVNEGSINFVDIDGNTTLDLLITGMKNSTTSAVAISKVFLNDGTGTFTEKLNTSLEGVKDGAITFADVDQNNTPDVLITGENNDGIKVARLYLNDGTGKYLEKLNTPFVGVKSGSVAVEDVDANGTLDMLITGQGPAPNGSINYVAKLYLNDGTGGFTEKLHTPFKGVAFSSAAFADVDLNSTSDLLIVGRDSAGQAIATLYLNDGTGTFIEKLNTSFIGVDGSSIAFADVDQDGDPDVLITGSNDGLAGTSKLYLNDGTGTFTEKSNTSLMGVRRGAIAFADVDLNGSLDVVLTGFIDVTTRVSKLYLNDGTGTFTEKLNTPFEQVGVSSIAFADVDTNGTQDLFITGLTNSRTNVSKLYLNDGTGTFTEKLPGRFPGVSSSSIAFADVDDNGTPDLLITGQVPQTRISNLYLNRDTLFTSTQEHLIGSVAEFRLYPNPTSGPFVYIRMPSGGDPTMEIQVFDITGKMWLAHKIVRHATQQSEMLDVSRLPQGSYLIQIQHGSKQAVKKLVIY